jgi:2-isopropylmalate synthase
MVMTQLREDLITETVRSVQGARRVIVHFYNAIAPAWREIVFGMDVPQIIAMVEHHIALFKKLIADYPQTEWVLQYSPKPSAWQNWTYHWPYAMPLSGLGMQARSDP